MVRQEALEHPFFVTISHKDPPKVYPFDSEKGDLGTRPTFVYDDLTALDDLGYLHVMHLGQRTYYCTLHRTAWNLKEEPFMEDRVEMLDALALAFSKQARSLFELSGKVTEDLEATLHLRQLIMDDISEAIHAAAEALRNPQKGL